MLFCNYFRPSKDTETEDDCLTDKIFHLLNAFKSKSLKYAERTPKCNKNLGSMWDGIQEVSDHLNRILSSGSSLPTDKFKIQKLIDVLKASTSLFQIVIVIYANVMSVSVFFSELCA